MTTPKCQRCKEWDKQQMYGHTMRCNECNGKPDGRGLWRCGESAKCVTYRRWIPCSTIEVYVTHCWGDP